MDEKPLRAFPPKNLPWDTRLALRQVYGRPVTLAVAPGTATTPGHLGQLALSPGGFHSRAYLRRSGVPAAESHPQLGTVAHHGKALEVEVYLP